MRFVPQLPSQFTDKNSKKSAKAQFIKKVKDGSNKKTQDAREKYKELLHEKMDELQAAAMKGAKYTFQLPGTDPTQTRELSKGAQEVLEKIAAKKAKREAKKREKSDIISITPKAFGGLQGGRIDGRGFIYDSKGQCIMEVCKKTGRIKNVRTGNIVGKFKPGCTYSEHRLCELIAKFDTSKQAGWHAGMNGHNGSLPTMEWGSDSNFMDGKSVWGGSSNASKQATTKDIWGNSQNERKNIWGHTTNDDNNGWW